MKQKHLLIYLLLLLSIGIRAQNKVSFDYDEAGNRISRKIVPIISGVKSVFRPHSEPIVEEMGERKIIIYPNPTKGALAVEVTGGDPKDEVRIVLFSAKGVMLQNIAAKVGKTPMDLSTYADAWYILRVTAGENKTEFKVVKQ
ncbi:MAG: T9SS type A sorting domain-containing protein [Bacteroidales bacterium]